MKSVSTLFAFLVVAAWSSLSLLAQQNTNTLAVDAIHALPSLSDKFAASGKSLSLRQVSEAMDGQLIDRINATRKFRIMAGSDLALVLKSQDRASSGNYNAKDPAVAEQFKLAGVRYQLITTLDDFEDQTERLEQKLARTITTKRTVRLGATAKIYETTTGALLESASNLINTNSIVETLPDASNNAEATDEILRRVTRDMAEWVANRVANLIFPVKVISRADKQVMINRGEAGGLVIGQIWTANAPGKQLTDPDTGEILGVEETPVGKVRITEILPKFSKAEVIEDQGIAVGAILRPTVSGAVKTP